MSVTATITNVCRIAEAYGHEIGLADFEIERVVRSSAAGRNEWIVHLQFGPIDPSIEPESHGAIIVIDAATEKPRLIEGL